MSETNLVSPLLDGFSMGNPISEHGGIRCCPAIRENTDKKYIVKIIAIPASQAQMDALLLAGAYKDPSDAMEYFRRQCEDVLKEAQLLKDLSKLSGFLSYEGWQMEPIQRYRLGYEVYLTGSYKRSLDRYIRHHAMTHLEAINLGLDMCSALSVCRQAGHLYVDLKPGNIFLSDKKEYRIGDLGFLSMDSLRYAALPEKYLSSYTPPELYDPMASVNLTADTYALGMILYQLYNDGHLPFQGKAPEEALPSPVQADYELAEIILKAIHPDPEQRYQDPAQMGKALASYMQRNSVNDVPITPLRTRKSKKKKKQEEPEVAALAEVPEEPVDAVVSDEPVAESVEEILPEETEVSAEEVPEASEDLEEAEDPALPSGEETEEPNPAEEDEESSETEPEESSEETEEAPEDELKLSEELSRILAKADDLIAHETPEPIQVQEVAEEDPFAFAQEEEIDDSDVPYDSLMEEEEPEAPAEKKKKEQKFIDPKYARRRKRIRNAIITLLALAAIGAGSFWYYQNLFLQAVNALTVTGDQTQITVQVDSPVEDDQLTVTCLSETGKSKVQSLIGGQAVFTDLSPNTQYTITVDISGFHRLTGKTSEVYTTQTTTQILSFTSVAGQEDGSVVLDFTVMGEEPSFWNLYYSADGEEEKSETFTGHSVTVSGLSLGKRYTFRLDAGDTLSLSGETSLEILASRLILAKNFQVTSGSGDAFTIQWDAPGDVVVESWDVRCYNNGGYDQTYTVAEPQVQFTGINPNTAYTVEVTASGMTQPARYGISANPISLSSLDVVDNGKDSLEVSWEFTGDAPEGGWLLMYTIDGGGSYVVSSNTSEATVSPRIPGAKYVFTLESADGITVFNNVHSYTVEEAASFEANKLTADMLTIDFLKTPSGDKWYCENISDEQITDQFQLGDGISLMLRSSDTFYLPGSETKVLFVIRDAYGNVLPQYTQEQAMVWKNIWTGGDSKNGELDLPTVPEYPGEFALSLYFDGQLVAELSFTIAE